MEGGVLLGGYVILTDSSCDLPPELAEELQLQTIPLTFTVGGKNYLNYLDERELSIQYFYGMLRHGQAAYTSAVNIEAFRAYMEPILSAGEDILFLSFSSALSATFQNSLTAASMLSQQYPERKIHCVDTRCASLGQGLLVYLTAERRDEGANLDEATAFAEERSRHICHWFTVDDPGFLKRGGRAAPGNNAVGAKLHVEPILRVDEYGCLVGAEKVRGRRAAIRALAEKAEQYATPPLGQTIFISHGDCQDDAEELAALVRERLRPRRVVVHPVGPVIGAHAGPGTLALFFVGDAR